jgi:hypothetical protein
MSGNHPAVTRRASWPAETSAPGVLVQAAEALAPAVTRVVVDREVRLPADHHDYQVHGQHEIWQRDGD